MTTTKQYAISQVYYDIAFKHLFGTDDNIKFTKYLLSAFYKCDKDSLENIKILNSSKLSPDNIRQKRYETDILVYFPDGSIVNLEVYFKPKNLAYRKSQMYVYKLLSRCLHSGEDYDLVPKITQIDFIKHGMMNRCDDITLFGVKDRLNNSHVPDELFEIYEINMDKIRGSKMSSKQKRLIEFINADSEEEMKKVAKKDKVIKEMYEELKKFCQSEEYYNWGFDRDSFIRQEGKEEGKVAGREEGISFIIKTMLKNNVSEEDISKFTNLSIQEINEIINYKT